MTVEYKVRDGVAVITFSNLSVNGLGHPIRPGIVEGMVKVGDDTNVKAIVIIGAGKAFSGDADIREFNTLKATQEPTLHAVIKVVEPSSKPIVVAIHSMAMGGGLELTMDYRFHMTAPGARIALPEVKLGILPDAGGMQRLPRTIGLGSALNMIVSGNVTLSERLVKSDLSDQMIEGDLIAGATDFALKAAAEGKLPKLRDRKVEYDNPQGFLQFAHNTVVVVAKNFPVPDKCVDAVQAVVGKRFDDGIKFERDLFTKLVNTSESRALRYAFFGERAVSKIPDAPESTPVRKVEKVAMISADTMGGDISMNFLNAGTPVTILETKQEALDRGVSTIRRNYENSAKKDKLT